MEKSFLESERGDEAHNRKKKWALFLIALCCFITNMCFSARDGFLALFADQHGITGKLALKFLFVPILNLLTVFM